MRTTLTLPWWFLQKLSKGLFINFSKVPYHYSYSRLGYTKYDNGLSIKSSFITPTIFTAYILILITFPVLMSIYMTGYGLSVTE
jgi:hypothetical protein